MQTDPKKVRNIGYLWACRIAAWGSILFNIPLCLFNNYESGNIVAATLPILFYCYIAIGSYILGYRLDNPPRWSRWVVPQKWIDEWRYLVYADPESIKSNRNRLLQFSGGIALLVILILFFLHEQFQ